MSDLRTHFSLFTVFCTNYGLPHFYGNFQEYLNTIYNSGEFSEYISFFRNNSRIMSGFGSIFFELGFIAILLVYIIIHDFIIIGRKKTVFFSLLFDVFNSFIKCNAVQ